MNFKRRMRISAKFDPSRPFDMSAHSVASARRHRRTPGRHSAALTEASFDEVSVISFKGTQAGVEKFALRDDHDVEPWGDLVSTKDLSNQSFSSVSLHRPADLPARDNAEP